MVNIDWDRYPWILEEVVIDCILYLSNGKVSHLVHIVYWYAGCVKCFEKVYMVLNQVWKWLEKTVMVSLSEACHLSLLSLGLNRVGICITPHTYFVAWCLPHRTLVRLDQMNSSQDKRVNDGYPWGCLFPQTPSPLPQMYCTRMHLKRHRGWCFPPN